MNTLDCCVVQAEAMGGGDDGRCHMKISHLHPQKIF